jgi:hypothetical protein
MSAAPNTSLSLWHIEDAITQLMDMREEATEPEDIAVIEGELVKYAQQEVRKVDNILGYLKHCAMMEAAAKEEAAAQAERARLWKERSARLKRACQSVMETFTGGDRKKIEGRTGALLLKGNGGRQAVTISDPLLVPEEYCDYVGSIPGEIWREMLSRFEPLAGVPLIRTPRAARIYEALQAKCEACGGDGLQPFSSDGEKCSSCGGSGQAGVPGAQLEPRGAHIEIK